MLNGNPTKKKNDEYNDDGMIYKNNQDKSSRVSLKTFTLEHSQWIV